jgi:hypothetical protein
VPTATFVKIDEVKERKVGTDIDAIQEWEEDDNNNMSSSSSSKRAVNDEPSDSYIPDGYTQD